jgi:UDP:flavonoid glycosyltransferase YjiC (YdhE family)
LVFTFGTANQHTRGFFRAAAEACRRLGRRGILITKYAEDLPDGLPDGVRHFSYVPFGYLLPRAAVLVHHAGTGTTAQGLAAGIPQLVTPMTFGQPQNAASLVRLGVGISISHRAFRSQRVADLLQRLLTAPSVAERCRDLARRFQGVNPLEQTCELLEQMAGSDAAAHAPMEATAAAAR